KSTATDTFFYHYDGHGNVVQMSDAAKAVVAEYRYDAFGNTLSATGAQASSNRYRFSTKEQHTVSGLYDYGYRFYSPGLGRWLNRDPIEETGGLNLYGFVGNNAANSVDPYGESILPLIKAGIKIWLKPRPKPYSPSTGPKVGPIRPAQRPKSGCFTAGTLIATSEGSKPIEEVQVGDQVWARDEKTGKLALQRVTHTFKHEVDQLVVLHIEGEDIETTAEHPFWVQGKGWVKAGELQTGDVLERLNGSTLTIQDIEVVVRACRVYNLEVEGFHTYFVAKQQVFVHNKAKPKRNKPRPTPTPCPTPVPRATDPYGKPYPIGKRVQLPTRKAAEDAARTAGGGRKPVHHKDDGHGPHFHPGDGKGKPLNHDHYYY
ncbi:MAG: hypothetical protein JWN98_2460, partial [Abditibacteriota bacterium]|nr:hypothetical protein [Abditibacteriota bacterium]